MTNPTTQADPVRAAAEAVPAPTGAIEDPVTVPRGLLGAACAAIRHKYDAPKTLEQLGRYTVGDLSREAPQAVPVGGGKTPKFNTTAAGRGEVARFFEQHLKRHDFTRYINEALAADFACALAPTLHALTAAPPQVPQPLTDTALRDLARGNAYPGAAFQAIKFARAVERAHGITGPEG